MTPQIRTAAVAAHAEGKAESYIQQLDNSDIPPELKKHLVNFSRKSYICGWLDCYLENKRKNKE